MKEFHKRVKDFSFDAELETTKKNDSRSFFLSVSLTQLGDRGVAVYFDSFFSPEGKKYETNFFQELGRIDAFASVLTDLAHWLNDTTASLEESVLSLKESKKEEG